MVNSPVNNPLSGPAFSTWPRSSQTGSNTDTYQEETDAGFATTYGESAETSTTSTPKARSTSKLSSLDNHCDPAVFHGLSSEDAVEFLDYVERFTTYKQMSEDDKVQFVGILIRSAAGDFYDSLSGDTDSDSSSSWETFRGILDTICMTSGYLMAGRAGNVRHTTETWRNSVRLYRKSHTHC